MGVRGLTFLFMILWFFLIYSLCLCSECIASDDTIIRYPFFTADYNHVYCALQCTHLPDSRVPNPLV